MNREELIALAAKALDCEGKTAHGHWIYRDPKTGLWVVSDDSIVALGKALERWDAVTAVHAWCQQTDATEVDVGAFVRDFGLGDGTDLDELMALCESTASFGPVGRPLYLLLRFFRQDVVDTIRINSEIDRDHDGEGPGMWVQGEWHPGDFAGGCLDDSEVQA
jgi:hypothetical protein